MNKKVVILLALLLVVGVAAYFLWSGRQAAAGLYGGDLIAIDNGKAYAEVLTNEKTGEVMTHVWEPDLKTPRPIEDKPLTIGSEEHRLELMPHPTDNDPAGRCSRFYGRADWVRGGNVHHGWLQLPGDDGERREFNWKRCWSGGREHGRMWDEMERHRRMGMHGRHAGPGGNHPQSGKGDDSSRHRANRREEPDARFRKSERQRRENSERRP